MNKNESKLVETNPPEGEPIPEDDSLASQIRELLADGVKGKDIIEMGYAESTVRQEARKWAKKNGNAGNGKPTASLTIKEKETVIPEWLEGQVAELMDGSVANQKAFIAGMAIPLLGMRMWAEGCKPMLELMRVDQARQAEAAKAASGGSEDVAQQTIVQAMPYFKDMITEVSRNQAVNPMQSMFVRMLEAPLQGVMSNLFTGMFKQPGQPQGQGQQAPSQSGLPPGWTTSEEEK